MRGIGSPDRWVYDRPVSAPAPSDQTSSSDDQDTVREERPAHQARIALRDLGSLIPAIVAVGAGLAYGVLIVAYSEFYAELGVRPGEVGLELGPGLGGIVGVAVLLILALCVLFLYAVVISRWLAPASSSEAGKRPRTVLIAPLIVGGLITVVVIGLVLIDDARDAAARARMGRPVGPLTLLGLEVVALRADRADVRLADPKAAQSETYLALRDRTRLMYLGRSGNTIVLYDPDRQSSWQIPASLFTVRTVNCEEHVEIRDPVCAD
jgi:hypothetical protein